MYIRNNKYGTLSPVHLSLLIWLLDQIKELRRWEESYTFCASPILNLKQSTAGDVKQKLGKIKEIYAIIKQAKIMENCAICVLAILATLNFPFIYL